LFRLQENVNDLLKKLATSENTIDQLRMSQRITLHSESPAPGVAAQGQVAPPQHGVLINTVTRGQGLKAVVLGE
jgi:hypothetical protein